MPLGKQKLVWFLCLVALGFSLIFAAGPIAAAQWSQRDGIAWYKLWWIGLATTIASTAIFCVALRLERRFSFRQFCWLIIPLVANFLLTARAGRALEIAWRSSDNGALTFYGSCAGAFLAGTLVWIVILPCEQFWSPGRANWLAWQCFLFSAAFVTMVIAFSQLSQALLQSYSLSHKVGLLILQQWAQRTCMVTFVFLIVRLLLPIAFFSASDILGRTGQQSMPDVHS